MAGTGNAGAGSANRGGATSREENGVRWWKDPSKVAVPIVVALIGLGGVIYANRGPGDGIDRGLTPAPTAATTSSARTTGGGQISTSDPTPPMSPEVTIVPDFVKPLNMPAPSSPLNYSSLDVDTGVVSPNGQGADHVYFEKTKSGQFQLSLSVAIGTTGAVLPAGAPVPSGQQCKDAISANPINKPIRPLTSGLLVCVNGASGTALLELTSRPGSGGLPLRETYWSS